MDNPKMPPTLEEFYKNPSGKGITANNINAVRGHFENRLKYVLGSAGKKIITREYIESETSFYFHFLVPSDMGTNDYDVVFHLHDDVGGAGMSLKKWQIEFFSNCPSFIFTYAAAYAEHGLLIPFLANKYNRKVLGKLPAQKNPDLELGWDKSIYYALYTIMKNLAFTQRFILRRNAKPFDRKKLISEISTEDQIMEECQAGKTKTVVQLSFRQSKMSKLGHSVKKVAADASSHVVNAVRRNKTSGTSSTGRKYDVHTNSKGKIIGNLKIRGHRSRRRH